jgi:hypothetical protein
VQGSVRFRDGTPVADAPFSAIGEGPDRIKSTTDAAGAFVLDLGTAPKLRAFSVQVQGSPVRPFEGLPTRPPAGAPREVRWDVIVPNLARVVGRVQDATGRPVSGVGFRVATAYSGMGVLSSKMALSQLNGAFELTVPYEGQQRLTVWPRLDPEGTAEKTGDIQTIRDATLTREGVPKDAEVSFRPQSRKGTADECWPYTPYKEVHLIPEETLDAGTFVVGPLGDLELTLIDDRDETPIVGAEATIICPVRGAWILSEPTDAGGVTHLVYLPGSHVLMPRVAGYEIADSGLRKDGINVDIPPLGTARVTLRLDPTADRSPSNGGDVGVRVTGAYQEPICGAQISWGLKQAVTDLKGVAFLRWSSGEKADLAVRHPGYEDELRKDSTLNPMNAHIRLTPRGKATLRVWDEAGTAVPEIQITMQAESQGLFGDVVRSKATDGEHQIAPMTPGGQFNSLFVWSRAHGVAHVHMPNGVNAGERVYVTLQATDMIEGRCRDPDGHPVGGAHVFSTAPGLLIDIRHESDMRRLDRDLEGRRCIGYASTSSDGSFRILAPRRNGVLVVLSDDRGGVVHAYANTASASEVEILPPATVLLRRDDPSPIDQSVVLELTHPSIRTWIRSNWPASATELSVAVPVRSSYRAQLNPISKRGEWIGSHAIGEVDVIEATASVHLKSY